MRAMMTGVANKFKGGVAVDPTEIWSSFKFNQNSDVVTVPVVAANDLTSDQTWVALVWITSTTNHFTIINKGGTAANSYRAPYLRMTSGGLATASMYPTIGNNTFVVVNSVSSFNVGAWNTVSLTLTVSGVLKLRLNGVNAQSNYTHSGVGSTIGGSTPWLIGQRSTQTPDGNMVRPMCFNDTLTDNEIDSLASTDGTVPFYADIPSSITDKCVFAYECSGKDATGLDLSGTSDGTVAGSITVDGEDVTYQDYIA